MNANEKYKSRLHCLPVGAGHARDSYDGGEVSFSSLAKKIHYCFICVHLRSFADKYF
jgi:hypothetical protein